MLHEKTSRILDLWDKIGVPRDRRTEYLRRYFPDAESVHALNEEEKSFYVEILEKINALIEEIKVRWELLKYVPAHQRNSLRKATGKEELWELNIEELERYVEYLRNRGKKEEEKQEEVKEGFQKLGEIKWELDDELGREVPTMEAKEEEPVIEVKTEEPEAIKIEAVEVEQPQEMSLATIKYFQTLAIQAFKSQFFPDLKNPEQAVVKILRGRELGLPPMTSLEQIFVISGRTAMSAHIMGALIKRSGKYDYKVVEWDDKHCKIEFYQRGQLIGVSEFTMDDARRAGLLNRESWTKYPKNMLLARALAQGARAFCPDIFGGAVYEIRELEEEKGNA